VGLGVGTDDDAYEEQANEALERLSARYPTHADQLAQAGIGGTTKEDLVDEVYSVLKDAPERDVITKDYSEMLDESVAAREQSVVAGGKAAEQQLDAFGIRFWGRAQSYTSIGIASCVGLR